MISTPENDFKSNSLVVTGIGMISSVGRNAASSCASSRAGLQRLSAIENLNLANPATGEVEPVMGHIVSGLTDGFVGLGRLIRLGYAGLADLIKCTEISDWAGTGMFINLSSNFHIKEWQQIMHERAQEDEVNEDIPFNVEHVKKTYEAWLIPSILKLVKASIAPSHQLIYFGDQAGIIQLIKKTADYIVSGKLKRCIIGGIESLIDIDYLKVLNDLKLLKTPSNQAGFIPGECAAFILLEQFKAAKQRNAKIFSVIEAPCTQLETFHRLSAEPIMGKALSQSISDTISLLADFGVNTGNVIGNLNGDPYRGYDWGNTLVFLRTKHSWINLPEWYPAFSFGEIGAATGFAAICMSITAFVRNYSETDNMLIWVSNDDGTRGSLYIRAYRN